MADLSIQQVSNLGLILSKVAANAGGDEFTNSGYEVLCIRNNSGSPITLTIGTNYTVSGLSLQNQQIVISAGTEQLIGFFNTDVYNDSNGKVQLTYSDVTSLEVAVLQVA